MQNYKVSIVFVLNVDTDTTVSAENTEDAFIEAEAAAWKKVKSALVECGPVEYMGYSTKIYAEDGRLLDEWHKS